MSHEIYRILADIVLLLHLAFVIFVVAGGWLALRWRWIPWLHLPTAIWGVAIELGGWVCPLTPLENWLRRMGGEPGYSGGFVEHYLLPILYPPQLTRSVQLILAGVVVILNLVAYSVVVRSHLRSKTIT